VSDDVVHLPNGVSPLGHFVAHGRDALCLGRLATHKHVERIIAALAHPELAGVRLHVVGPEGNVSHLDLARVAEGFKIADRVLLHGRVNAARLAEIAADCALFVSASTYEGFGMSLIEAMSVGLIPVVHANPAFVELLSVANSGELADFKRPAAAARAMRRQLDNIRELDRRRAIAYAARFAWSGHAERTMRLYCAAQPLAISA
jgi:alpha-1,3-mannosyltransferase